MGTGWRKRGQVRLTAVAIAKWTCPLLCSANASPMREQTPPKGNQRGQERSKGEIKGEIKGVRTL